MKKPKRYFGVILLAAILAFSFAACSGPTDSEPATLTGKITIIPEATPALTGSPLSANYDGSEKVTLTYQWSQGGVAIPGETGKELIPQADGDYTVTISAAGYNSKTSDPVTVADDGKAKFSGKVTVTPAGPVLWGVELTADYDGTETSLTLTYDWYKDGVQVATGTDKYTPTQPGNYHVIVSDPNYTNKSSNFVTVNPKALSGNVSIEPAGTVTVDTLLTASYNGTDVVPTYQWYKNGTLITGATNAQYTPDEAGSYYVAVSAPGYTEKQSSAVTVTSSTGPTNTLRITMPASIFAEAANGYVMAVFPNNTNINDVFAEGSRIEPIAVSDDDMDGFDYQQSGSNYIITAPFYIDLPGSGSGYAPWTASGTFDIIAMLYNEGGETAKVYEYNSLRINSAVTPVTISQSNYVTEITFESDPAEPLDPGTIRISMPDSIYQQMTNGFMIGILPPGVTEEAAAVAFAHQDEEITSPDGGQNWILTAILRDQNNPTQTWTDNGFYDVFFVINSSTGERIYGVEGVEFNDGIASTSITTDNEVFPGVGPGPGPNTDPKTLDMDLPADVISQAVGGVNGIKISVYEEGTSWEDILLGIINMIASALNTDYIYTGGTRLSAPLKQGDGSSGNSFTGNGDYDVHVEVTTSQGPRHYHKSITINQNITVINITGADEVVIDGPGPGTGLVSDIDPQLWNTYWVYEMDMPVPIPGIDPVMLTLRFTETDISWDGTAGSGLDSMMGIYGNYPHAWIFNDGVFALDFDMGTGPQRHEMYTYELNGDTLILYSHGMQFAILEKQ